MAVYTQYELSRIRQAYDLLQVNHKATPEMIKKQYRTIVKQWHPDKWAQNDIREQQATDKVQEINAAYDLIEKAPLLNYREDLSPEPTPQKTAPPRSRYEARMQKYRTRRQAGNRQRHKSPEAAAAFRKRMGAQFRFVTGVIGSALPLALIRLYGLAGLPFMICCILLPLLSGWNAARKDVLEDEGGLF